MAERVAITGVGQTKHDAKRPDVSIAGLCREAAIRALEDANVGWNDVDAVVIGKAPDMFEGVVMPELYLADALGATGKPMMRVHTAGSVGGSTALVAAGLVKAGVHKRVLTVAFEKQSESNAMWALSMRIPFEPALVSVPSWSVVRYPQSASATRAFGATVAGWPRTVKPVTEDRASEPLETTESRIHDGAPLEELPKRAQWYLNTLQQLFPWTTPQPEKVVLDTSTLLAFPESAKTKNWLSETSAS